MRKQTVLIFLFCLFTAFLALLIPSTCSPLYATSFWTDTNIYFTIGRGIRHGLLPYRDLYDHKGPLLYWLYGLGAFFSEKSFLGIFLLEVLSLGTMLLLAYRIVDCRIHSKAALLTIPLTAILTVSCSAFNQGGSAEEFCLPFLAYALYYAFRFFFEKRSSVMYHLGFGAAAAGVFLIKYTVCGLFLGVGIGIAFLLLFQEGLSSAFKHIFLWIAGFLLILFPTLAVLAFQRSLTSFFQVYFVDNLTLYEGTPLSLTGHLYNALAYLRTQSAANPVVALFAFIGCIGTVLAAFSEHHKGMIAKAFLLPFAAGMLLLFVYWGEMAHPYYALVFTCLIPAGILFLCQGIALLESRKKRIPLSSCIVAGMVCIVPVTYLTAQARPLLSVTKDKMPQYQFASIMNENAGATLLDICSLDQGFYLASGILPSVRYFADNNLASPEKAEALKEYLDHAVTEYVVTCYRNPGEHYLLIAEADGLFDLAAQRHYYLYHKLP